MFYLQNLQKKVLLLRVCMRVCVSVDMCALMHTCVSVGPPECWCQTKQTPGPPHFAPLALSVSLIPSCSLRDKFTTGMPRVFRRERGPPWAWARVWNCLRACMRVCLCVKGLYNAKIDNGIRRRHTKRRTSLLRAGLVGSLVNTRRDTHQHTHKLWVGSHKFVQRKAKKQTCAHPLTHTETRSQAANHCSTYWHALTDELSKWFYKEIKRILICAISLWCPSLPPRPCLQPALPLCLYCLFFPHGLEKKRRKCKKKRGRKTVPWKPRHFSLHINLSFLYCEVIQQKKR